MEILWKGTVSSQFRAIRSKLCGKCAFPQNSHTRKLGEITIFFAVINTIKIKIKYLSIQDATGIIFWLTKLQEQQFSAVTKIFEKPKELLLYLMNL